MGADLAVALDPDADRCALGVPPPDGGWRMLTGDETGVLLGDHLLRAGGHRDPLVATTVASSSMLRSITHTHGARYAETLTGFKWIVRGGPGLVYGYEEALGYCVDPDAVRDKDGIAAAVLAADLAAGLRAEGRGLLDRLDELAIAHGVHRTLDLSFRLDPTDRDPTDRGAVLERLRTAPPAGWDLDRPAPDVLVLRRAGERLVVRPSGTEPKLKAYLQVVEPVPDPGGLAAVHAGAADRLAALARQVQHLLAGGRTHRATPRPAEPKQRCASLPGMPRPKLHDESLRLRLLEAAGRTLSARGLPALSLRTLAADVGTSTTAVYSLFGGKPGLIKSLFDEACRRFAGHLATVASSDDPVEDLVALGLAFRDGALAEPHLYDVMFTAPIGELPLDGESEALASAAFARLLAFVERAADAGELRAGAEPPAVALTLWATMHGLVSLQLRNFPPPAAGRPEVVFEGAMRAGVDGWRR